MPFEHPLGGAGRLVILVGPDGVGKTTVARALIEQHGAPAAYFHFVPPLRGGLAAAPDNDPIPPPPKAAAGASIVLGWIRILRNAARCWLGYLGTVRPALKRGSLVIGDRGLYGYLVQPDALKFRGPRVLARAIVCLLPSPDLIVNLSAPADLIRARKQELPLPRIEHELLAWSSLHLPNVRTLDSTRPPETIAAEILAALAPADGKGARWT